jgi:hypothetical protein
MCKRPILIALVMLVALVFVAGNAIQAGEIIYADDIQENIIQKEVLVRTADNVIVLVDSSSSMSASTSNGLTKPVVAANQHCLTLNWPKLMLTV